MFYSEKTSTRVLHVVDTLSPSSGVCSVVMDYIRNTDRVGCKIDVATHKSCDKDLAEEIFSFAGKVHRLPDISCSSFLKYKKAFADVLSKHPYPIVHGHVANSAFLYMREASRLGVPHRVMHAHSTKGSSSLPKRLRNKVLQAGIPVWCNHYFACSVPAAEYLYPAGIREQAVVLPNSIDPGRFRYDPSIRDEARLELGIKPGEFCLGHVGRFDRAKNHGFLLDMFASLQRQAPYSRLVLVGDGDLENSVRKKASDLGISGAVVFLGRRSDSERLFQAFDLFVMPSLFEGWGLAAMEAQCAGLPCLLSDKIPSAVNLTGNAVFLPLGDPGLWANAALKNTIGFERWDQSRRIVEKGLDGATQAERLGKIYREFLQGM